MWPSQNIWTLIIRGKWPPWHPRFRRLWPFEWSLLMSQLQNVILKFIVALETAHNFWIFYGKSQNNHIFQDFFSKPYPNEAGNWNVDVDKERDHWDKVSNDSFTIKRHNEKWKLSPKEYGFWKVYKLVLFRIELSGQVFTCSRKLLFSWNKQLLKYFSSFFANFYCSERWKVL